MVVMILKIIFNKYMWDLSIRVDPTFVGDKDNVINAHPVITPQKMTFQF